MPIPSIAVAALSKSYGRSRAPVFSDVHLEVDAGESLGLIGPNGAGKTTLVGCLLGFLRPTSGQVRLLGRAPEDLAVRTRLGYLPERLPLDPAATACALLSLHHSLAGRPKRSRAGDVTALLARVGLARVATQRVRTYSKGMRQRLGLALALVGRPSLLVLDEPASGMDPPGRLLLRGVLRELRERGATVLLNSHLLDDVARCCERVALLRDGQLKLVEAHDTASLERLFAPGLAS